jgi:hypothetical protein
MAETDLQATDSSPAPETAPSTPETAPSPAPESPSTPSTTVVKPGEAKETLLDAVLKVVPTTPEDDVLKAKTEAPGATPAAPPAKEGDQAEKKPDEGEDDTSTDEDDEKAATEAANPATRKKINKLLRQRRELRDEVSRLSPVAEIGNELHTFAKTNDLSGDDVILALGIAASLRKGDYQSFYQTVGPYVRRAQEYLGLVLPPDLAERVQQGQMTETAAKEFARTRFDHTRAEATAEAAKTAERGMQLQSVQSDIQRAVSSLEGRFAATDPDYKAKAGSVRRVAQAMLFERGGTIGSVQDALEITKAAYVEVSKNFRSAQPAPRPTLPTPNGHGQTPSVRAEPKTLMEAALLGLENSRRSAG